MPRNGCKTDWHLHIYLFSMYSSSLFTEEDLTDNEIESQPDLWVAAGTSYAVPVRIMQPGTTLKWSFTTTPKVGHIAFTQLCVY